MPLISNSGTAAHAASVSPAWGALPTRLRALLVSDDGQAETWLGQALAGDSAVNVALVEVAGAAAAAARLRDDSFDALLVLHRPGRLNALELVSALRSGGTEEAMLILGDAPGEMTALALEAGADEYVDLPSATTRGFLWLVARAVERQRLLRECRRLRQAECHRLQLEQQEAQRLLDEQRSLIRDLESLAQSAAHSAGATVGFEPPAVRLPDTRSVAAGPPLPAPIEDHYQELLRTYVIMGSGNLGPEMQTLGQLLVATGATAQQVLALHVRALEGLVRGLGGRSARHVMTRADLLVVDVLVHLAEGYRRLAAGLPEADDWGQADAA